MGDVVKYDRTLFEPEHDMFRASYRAFLDRHVAPHHEQWEQEEIVDRGVWLEAGKQGFLGMAVPEEYGSGFIYLMQKLPQDGRLAAAVCLASSAGQVFSLQTSAMVLGNRGLLTQS
jgi:alkylation response protein AidB-like acyl-CoA dehydrogenase